MHVDVREAGDAIVVDLEGGLVAGAGDELLREVLDELLTEGWTKIVLNLSEVERIDSSGIGELVAGTRGAARIGGRIKLVNVRAKVRDVLHLSQVLAILDVYDDEEEALASFEPAADAASG